MSGCVRVEEGGAFVMGQELLRIGELASRAQVSRRTVDFYTGLGLLAPNRSAGNFRLYRPADVQRITAIRRLEAQGIRLDEIAHLINGPATAADTRGSGHSEGPGPADPADLKGHLTSLDEQVRALRELPDGASSGSRGAMLATLVARAQVLITTALILSDELLPGAEFLPPI